MSRHRTVDTATTADWKFAEDPEVMERISAVAARICREFPNQIEEGDLVQELIMCMAVRPKEIRSYMDNEYEGLYHRLCDHGTKIRQRYSLHKMDSYNEWEQGVDE